MGTAGGQTWPAQIIHVNEDGWVLVNRGTRHGVLVGLPLLVVSPAPRDLRDLRDVSGDGTPDDAPAALRIRRTFELLEVIHAEEACAIAIAARTPQERRPSIYRGPENEVLVWVPLPPAYTYPDPLAPDDDAAPAATDDADATDAGDTDDSDSLVSYNEPPTEGDQNDRRWEHALPLNGVNVGDNVVLARPITAPGASALSTSATAATNDNPFESGRDYDWARSR